MHVEWIGIDLCTCGGMQNVSERMMKMIIVEMMIRLKQGRGEMMNHRGSEHVLSMFVRHRVKKNGLRERSIEFEMGNMKGR